MIKNKLFSIFSILLSILLLVNFVNANVEVFSNYETILKVNSDNTIEINKSLTLKNVYEVGIVPGQIEFKVGKGTEGSIGNIDIFNVSAKDSFGNEIKSQLRTTKDYSVIILDLYYPLLPGFEYEFHLNYKLSYEPGGIFFKSLQIPIRESTIPIQEGNFKVVLPNNYYFTHLESDGENKGVVDGNSVNWEIKDNYPKSVSFEYSYIPLTFTSIKGSYAFWIIINVLLLLVLIFEIRKEIKRVRTEMLEE